MKVVGTTTQAVSAALRKAGHQRSTNQKSSIRGWQEFSAGYRVRRHGEDDVTVEWLPSSLSVRTTPQSEVDRMIEVYREDLTKAGFFIEDELSALGELIVVGRKAA